MKDPTITKIPRKMFDMESMTSLPEAPQDGLQYSRCNGEWKPINNIVIGKYDVNTTVTNTLSVFKDGAQFVSDDNNINGNTVYNIWYDPHVGNMAIGLKNSNKLFISRDRGRTFLDISRLTNDSYPASNESFLYIAFDYLHNHMYAVSSDAYIYVLDLNEETLRFRKLYDSTQYATTGMVYHRGTSKIIVVTRDMNNTSTGFNRVAIIDSITSSAPTIVNLPYDSGNTSISYNPVSGALVAAFNGKHTVAVSNDAGSTWTGKDIIIDGKQYSLRYNYWKPVVNLDSGAFMFICKEQGTDNPYLIETKDFTTYHKIPFIGGSSDTTNIRSILYNSTHKLYVLVYTDSNKKITYVVPNFHDTGIQISDRIFTVDPIEYGISCAAYMEDQDQMVVCLKDAPNNKHLYRVAAK